MLRDLSTVLLELQQGLQSAAGHGMRITRAETTLPVDVALVLKDDGCALLADVARNVADAAWFESPSRLTLHWAEMPTEWLK